MTSVAIFTQKARRKLAAVKRGVDSRALLQAVANDQIRWINRNFLASGLEKRWPILRASTVFARRKGSSRPLMDTGRLRQSFVRGRRGNVYLQPFSDQIVIGSNLEYAKFHEEGTAPYVIVPKNKKALAFPHHRGPRTLRKMATRRFNGKSGFVVPFVDHPGLPQRKMLPTRRLAEFMGRQTLEKIFNAVIRQAGRG